MRDQKNNSDRKSKPDFKKSFKSKADSSKKADSSDKPSFNKNYKGRPDQSEKSEFASKPDFKKSYKGSFDSPKKSDSSDRPAFKKEYKGKSDGSKKWFPKKSEQKKIDREEKDRTGIRLNKYVANAGICSRREADVLIPSGVVEINGKVVTELGVKVLPTDIVKYDGQTLKRDNPVYILMNKPKGFSTTIREAQNRKTVVDLTGRICKEKVFPIGKLDKDTTGVLLLTNDNELEKRLTNPKYGIKNIYHVHLDKPVKPVDLEKLTTGITLEDGIVKADSASYVGEAVNKKEVGLELQSTKYQIVKRMFEKIGFTVMKLDRVSYAGLTKKRVPRAEMRFLTPEEILFLKRIK